MGVFASKDTLYTKKHQVMIMRVLLLVLLLVLVLLLILLVLLLVLTLSLYLSPAGLPQSRTVQLHRAQHRDKHDLR